MESTITYNDLLVNNLSDELPPLALTAEDSDGDTQIVAALDLNSVKILENRVYNPVTLDVPTSAINLTDVYAKNVSIPLDFQIIPPVLKKFWISIFPFSGDGKDLVRAERVDIDKYPSDFQFTISSINITDTGLYGILQFRYESANSSSNWLGPSFWRIYLDVVRVTGSSTYGKIYPGCYYTVIDLSDYFVDTNAKRVCATGIGDVPGINQQNVNLFAIYDDSTYPISDTNEDEVAPSYNYNEGAVLRLSPQMISFAEFIQDDE